MTLFLQLLANGMVNGAVFALLACAFGLVYRSVGVFHIAFAGLLLIAPYTEYVASSWFGFPLWLAMPLGIGVGVFAGYLTDRALYRPFYRRKASPAAVMIASLGAFVILENVLAIFFGNEIRFIHRSTAVRTSFGVVIMTQVQLLQLGLSVATLLGFGAAIRRMKVFKAIWAMGDEPTLIPVLGLPLMKYRTIVFCISAGMGSLAACLLTADVGLDPHIGMSYLLIAAVAMLAGGVDRFAGWIVGGFSLAVLQSASVLTFSPQWTDLVTFGVLISVLVFRPQGLLGLRKRLEET